MRIFARYLSASTSTYDLLRPWLKLISWSLVTFHILFSLTNVVTNESEPFLFRSLAILVLIPYIKCSALEKTKLAHSLKNGFLVCLTITGPFFLFSGLILELSSSNPDLVVVVRREFEFIAALGILLLACADILITIALSATLIGILTLIFLSFASINLGVLELSWVSLMSGYAIASIGLVMIIRKRTDIAHNRSELSSAIGSAIAHELRTPLLSIKTRAQALDKFVPDLVRDNKPENPNLNARKFDLLEDATRSIIEEANSASTLIDIFLVNASAPQDRIPISERFLVGDAIQEAISRFPYRSSREREAVSYDSAKNFQVNGPRLLLVHVFFNLIKNSFEQIGAVDNPEVTIIVDQTSESNTLTFRDNGPGVTTKDLKKIFDPFYSNSGNYGTGVGLAFCKQTLDKYFAGTIECDSDLGRFTAMNITFPRDKT